jgi:hypothetical protein
MIDDLPAPLRRSRTAGNVTAPTFGVATVHLSWTIDPHLPDGAFRLRVLLADDTLPDRVDDDDLALLLNCTAEEIRDRYRQLESAGHLVQRVDGEWTVR